MALSLCGSSCSASSQNVTGLSQKWLAACGRACPGTAIMTAYQYQRTRDAKDCDNDDGHEEAAMEHPEFAHQISLLDAEP